MSTNRYGINRLRPQEIFDSYESSYVQPQQERFQNFSVQSDPEMTFDPFPLGGVRPQSIFETFGAAPPTRSSVSQVSTTPTSTTRQDREPTSNGIEELVRLRDQIYSPVSRASDRYNELLDNAPQMNRPSLGRALVAGTAAFGANAKGKDLLDISDRIMYSPYLRDKAEWETKTKPYYDAANLENNSNNIERQAAGNLVTNYTANRRADQQNDIAQQRVTESERAARAREENNRTLARIREYTAMKWTTKVDGDRWIGISPDGRQVVDLGASGGLDEADVIAAKGRAQAAQQVFKDKNGNYYERNPDTGILERIQGDPGGLTPATGSGSGASRSTSGAGTMSMADKLKQRQMRMEQLMTTPEGSRWIQYIQGQGYSMKKRPPDMVDSWWPGGIGDYPNTDQINEYETVRRAVFEGEDADIPSGGAGGSDRESNPVVQSGVNTGDFLSRSHTPGQGEFTPRSTSSAPGSSAPVDPQQLGRGSLTPSQYSPYDTPIFRPEVEQGLRENRLVIVEDAQGKQLGTIENNPTAIAAYMRDYPDRVIRRPSQPNQQMPPMGRTGAPSQLPQQLPQQNDTRPGAEFMRTPDGTPSTLGGGEGVGFVPATNGMMFPPDIQQQVMRGERVLVKKGDRVVGTIPNVLSTIITYGGRGFSVMNAAGNRPPEDR